MPRDGSGQYHMPPGTPGVPNTTIASARYNAFTSDVEQDLNTPRPIVAGGTGATSAAAALAALSGETASQVVSNYDSQAFLPGSFYSATTAIGTLPVANHAFAGICYFTDASNMVLEARDITDPSNPVYVRVMTGGVWGAWKRGGTPVFVSDAPPTSPPDNSLWWESDTGVLYVRYHDPSGDVQWVNANPVPTPVVLLRSYLAGLTLANFGNTAITVAPGQAADSTNTDMINLPVALTKTNAIWAAGNNSGGLDTGAMAGAATWYHFFAIKNPATQAVDVLFSLSATAPTLPSGFTLFRRIGACRWSGSAWQPFSQQGDFFLWTTPQVELSNIAITSGSFVNTLAGVPPGVRVIATIQGFMTMSAANTTNWSMFYPTDGNYVSGGPIVATAGGYGGSQQDVLTDTLQQVRRFDASGQAATLLTWTIRYLDRRGRDA